MCGIIGVFGPSSASQEVFRGLLTLQHRGQDAAGILSFDFSDARFHLVKNKGLVSEVFKQTEIEELPGSMAIGHTRYATVGKGDMGDIQPFVANYPYGIGLCHNGNLVNYFEQAQALKEKKHCHSLTSSDLEVLLNLFAQGLATSLEKKNELTFASLTEATRAVFREARGGYSVIGLVAGEGLFAFRDPRGIRPLVLGRRGQEYCLASETVAFNFLGYEFVRDVLPGELLFIDRQGQLHSIVIESQGARECMFEWIYFSSPESVLSGKAVYATRSRLGQGLAKKVTELMAKKEIAPDVVVAVPETGRIAALALAEASGIPYREALIKNRYVYRSFILSGQKKRENTVDVKLGPVVSEIKGKNILLVDDSIVRGTTSRRLVELLKRAGAREVYFASLCPPVRHPCFYGVDFPLEEELVAANHSEAEVAQKIGADKVIYQDLAELAPAIERNLCRACLDGDYPVDVSSAREFAKKRKQHRGV